MNVIILHYALLQSPGDVNKELLATEKTGLAADAGGKCESDVGSSNNVSKLLAALM